MAFGAVEMQPPDDGGNIRISSNENARGPGRKTVEALQNAISPRVGRGYPPDYTGDLVGTIADLLQSRPRSGHRRHRLGSDPRRRDAGVLLGPEAARDGGANLRHSRSGGAPHRRAGQVDSRRSVHGPRYSTRWRRLRRAPAWCSSATRTTRRARSTTRQPWSVSSAASNRARRIRGSCIDEAYIDYAHDANVKTTVPLTATSRAYSSPGRSRRPTGWLVFDSATRSVRPRRSARSRNAWSLGSVQHADRGGRNRVAEGSAAHR